MSDEIRAIALKDRIAEFPTAMAKNASPEVVTALGVCDLQLRAYEEILPEIRLLGAEFVAISPQTPDYALSDVEKKGLTFPVLTDAHNQVARQYGLVLTLSDVLELLQETFGNPIPKFNGDGSWELPMPGTFVLSRSGLVSLAHVDPDYTRRLEPAAILDTLRGTRS